MELKRTLEKIKESEKKKSLLGGNDDFRFDPPDPSSIDLDAVRNVRYTTRLLIIACKRSQDMSPRDFSVQAAVVG